MRTIARSDSSCVRIEKVAQQAADRARRQRFGGERLVDDAGTDATCGCRVRRADSDSRRPTTRAGELSDPAPRPRPVVTGTSILSMPTQSSAPATAAVGLAAQYRASRAAHQFRVHGRYLVIVASMIPIASAMVCTADVRAVAAASRL